MRGDDTTMTISGPDGLHFSASPAQLRRVTSDLRAQQGLPGFDDELEEPTEEERAQGEDDLRDEELSDAHRAWQRTARDHLLAEEAVTEIKRRSKKTRLKLGVVYRHATEGCAVAAQLTVTYAARGRQLADAALNRYLAELATYEGQPCEVAEQVCHDLYVVLRPKTIKVCLVSKLHGVERSEEEEREWIW